VPPAGRGAVGLHWRFRVSRQLSLGEVMPRRPARRWGWGTQSTSAQQKPAIECRTAPTVRRNGTSVRVEWPVSPRSILGDAKARFLQSMLWRLSSRCAYRNALDTMLEAATARVCPRRSPASRAVDADPSASSHGVSPEAKASPRRFSHAYTQSAVTPQNQGVRGNPSGRRFSSPSRR
jgi:hypothetical protein